MYKEMWLTFLENVYNWHKDKISNKQKEQFDIC